MDSSLAYFVHSPVADADGLTLLYCSWSWSIFGLNSPWTHYFNFQKFQFIFNHFDGSGLFVIVSTSGWIVSFAFGRGVKSYAPASFDFYGQYWPVSSLQYAYYTLCKCSTSGSGYLIANCGCADWSYNDVFHLASSWSSGSTFVVMWQLSSPVLTVS